jgi:hypothetical protein
VAETVNVVNAKRRVSPNDIGELFTTFQPVVGDEPVMVWVSE